MNAEPAYVWNKERFERFYDLQRNMTRHLSRHPAVVDRWLKSHRFKCEDCGRHAGKSKAWRTARLNVSRRRELKALIADAAEHGEGAQHLGQWLLSAMPVRTYLEITDFALPNLRLMDAEADDCRGEMIRARDSLFVANLGLARNAAMGARGRDYNERLSAASCGLLDAIDRYVPGPTSARFSYFASYWIRYHVSRHAQKFASLVSFPINQQRIERQIERYLDGRTLSGEPPPSLARLCADLQISVDAYYWSGCRPTVVSIHDCVCAEGGFSNIEQSLCDPGPEPAEALDERETADRLKSLLRAHVCPETRMMLAYCCGIGELAEAAEDYLANLRETAVRRVRQLAQGIGRRRLVRT